MATFQELQGKLGYGLLTDMQKALGVKGPSAGYVMENPENPGAGDAYYGTKQAQVMGGFDPSVFNDYTFDWRQTGPQTWAITLEARGGARFQFDQSGTPAGDTDQVAASPLAHEYRAMLKHFVDLVDMRRSDVDLAPLELIADAFLRGTTAITASFED